MVAQPDYSDDLFPTFLHLLSIFHQEWTTVIVATYALEPTKSVIYILHNKVLSQKVAVKKKGKHNIIKDNYYTVTVNVMFLKKPIQVLTSLNTSYFQW